MIRNIKHLIATALFALVGTMSAWAQPSGGGTGTSGDPYLIGTAADLKAFAEYVNGATYSAGTYSYYACAKLTADIDLSTVCSETLGSWPGIGTNSNGYCGTFDGQGYTVSGLYIHDDALTKAGFFTYLLGAKVRNLKIGGHVYAGTYAGMVAGKANNSSQITNVEVLEGSVETKVNRAGGICGELGSGTLTDCVNRASVITHSGYAGGITSDASGTNSALLRCFNYGAVSDGYDGCAGIACYVKCSVRACGNFGTVTGNSHVAGVAREIMGNGVVENCFNAGDVKGYNGAGFVCSLSGTVRNCFNSGNATFDDTSKYDCSLFLARDNGGSLVYENNYILASAVLTYGGEAHETDKACPGYASHAAATTALTAADFQSGKAAFLLQGDQPELWWTQAIGTDNIPVLSRTTDKENYRVYFGGTIHCDGSYEGAFTNTSAATVREDHNYGSDGFCANCHAPQQPATVESVYQIANLGNLIWLRDELNYNHTANVKAAQTADIDLSPVCSESAGNWLPISDHTLTNLQGVKGLSYDGQGHTITGLYYHSTKTGSEHTGLFGRLSNGCRISNIRMEDVSIDIPQRNNIGAIAGSIYSSTIENCIVASGSVKGYINVGGVVGNISGYGKDLGIVTGCQNFATVKAGYRAAGGIVGYANGNGEITDCNNAGRIIESGSYAGGIAGRGQTSTIARCANVADVQCVEYAGGIIGYIETNAPSLVEDCFSAGTITSNNPAGIVARCYEKNIRHCLFTGNIVQNSSANDYGLIVGYAYEKDYATFTDCYYSASCQVTQLGNPVALEGSYYAKERHGLTIGQSVSADQLQSGAVAFALQALRDNLVWGQTIGTDPLPQVNFTFRPTQEVHLNTGTVDCAGHLKTPATYANVKGPEAQYLDHVFDADGICTVCHEYQQPELVDGVYQIATLGQFCNFRDYVNNVDATASAALRADIDLSPLCGTEKGNFTPFKDFQGNFDGQSHKITGFFFDNQNEASKYSYIGLFCKAGHNTTPTRIHHLDVEGTINSRAYDNDAILVGYAVGHLAIDHCTTRGKLNGREHAGGLVGWMAGYSTLSDCANYATVSCGGGSVSGVVGYLYQSNVNNRTIANTVNYGTVSGTDLVGGIVGYKLDTYELRLQNVANYGNISSSSRAAGIIGTRDYYTTIDGAFVSGDVSAQGSTGGIIMLNPTSAYPITRAYYDASLTLVSAGSPVDITTTADNGKATGVSHDDVVAGRAAYLLGEGWGQQLPGGTVPVIGGPRVYYGRYQHAVAEPIYDENRYSNTIVFETATTHDFQDDVCTICGKHDGADWADIDGDGDFDLDDVNALRSILLGTADANPKADLNGDGKITIADIVEAIHQLIMP